MRHRTVILCAVAGTFAGSPLACAQLIGADFDVSPCANDRCVQTIAEGIELPWGIAVDEEWIYWTVKGGAPCEQRAGRVMKRAKSGGDPVVIADGQACPNRLALDASYVYWTNAAGAEDGGPGGQVMRLRRDAVPGADPPEELAGGQIVPTALAVSPTHVYWGTLDPAIKGLALDALDAAPQVLLDGAASERDDAGLTAPSLSAIDDAYVYVTEFAEPGGVWKVPMDAGQCCADGTAGCPEAGIGCDFALRLAKDQPVPNGIALGAGVVYFVTFVQGGWVKSVSKSGGGIPELLASNQDKPADLASDGAHLYWTNAGDGTVRRVALPFGQTETVASDQEGPNSIAVDETYVYWTVHTPGGAVRMAPKEPQL
jgi:hypothetical protein